MIDLWIKNKYTGDVHKIGDDPHDCLMVDEEGTVRYYNLQCGDGCKGYKSVNRETLADKYPDKDWGKRSGEYTSGYEFVPNTDEYGYPYDPTEREEERDLVNAVLDKIRAEIKQLPYQRIFGNVSSYSLLDVVVEIIDKYRESEDT